MSAASMKDLPQPSIDRILGARSGRIFARCRLGTLYGTHLKPVLPIDPEFASDPLWTARKALSQAAIVPQLFNWVRSDAGSAIFDEDVAMDTRTRFGW